MSHGPAQKGVQPVSDNGGSLTVDGTVELGAASLAALESITVVDGGGSLTVDGAVSVSGTVALDAPSLAALETIQVGSSALPANAAQETGGNLATIAAASGLAATAANQTTELASLATIAAELGPVSSSPGAYTVMDRLNVIARKLDGVCKTGATEATLQKLLAALKPVPGGSAVRATLLHR